MAKQSRPKVILTRPAAQSARFAAMLTRHFGTLEILPSPLIEPEFLSPPLPRTSRAVIFTSQTGVAAVTGRRDALPDLAFCVGDRTARAAAAAGFTAQSAGADAEALLQMILLQRPQGPLLHLRGEDSRGDLAARLTAAGIPTQAAVIYVQRPRPLSPDALAALRGCEPVICPVFSPRTASLLAAALPRPHAPLQIAALSVATAEPLCGCGIDTMEISQHPTPEALLDAMARLPAMRPAFSPDCAIANKRNCDRSPP